MAAIMSLSPGAKLGQYEIIAPIGAGGMGEVYRARDLQLGREVAIKILPASLSRDPDRLRRFEQEARAAAALNHPNILAVYQFGTHEGSPYLVSELLEGSTLREHVLRGPLPIRKAVDFGIQVARGLAAAHEKGIVHRDLKPENLFATKDGRVKILDFGLAKLIQNPQASEAGTPTLTEATEPGVVLGTVGYMSPEQVRGQTADARTDLFALGAILYEMLTGKRAFHKPTSPETMSAILNEEPPPTSQVVPSTPPAMQRVVQRCLEKNPEQRFHSASDLAFALEALSDSGSAPTGAFASQKAETKWWPVAAAVLLLIAAALTLWMTRSPAVPVVESVVQLTNDGQAKPGAIEADASRIYFNEGAAGSFRIAQVSVTGGQTGEIPTDVLNPSIAGLSLDGSSLLVMSGALVVEHETLWLVPLPAGQSRRVSDADVDDGSLFPDGRVLYRTHHGIFVAGNDGTNPRKLEGLSDYVPRVSPDGKRFVYIASDRKSGDWLINESSADATGIRTILRQRPDLPSDICCVRWTEDGNDLLFRGKTGGRWDLWGISDQNRFLGKTPASFHLTNGPLSYTAFAGSRDGKQVFAVGSIQRGELLHYDVTAHQFLPYLGGISATDPTFSRDGRWVAYLSYPDRTLWRSRADGSERLQLTYPPVAATFERISPDGSQVAFSDDDGHISVIGINGGSARQLSTFGTAPDWSPDGKFLAITAFVNDTFVSQLLEVSSAKKSDIPGSRGMLGPWYAGPDALIATANDQSKLVRYDFKTQKWSDLLTSPDRFVNWETSPDNKYFIYSTGGKDPTVFRMRLSDRTIEKLASLKDVHTGADPATGPSLSASPDDSALVMRDIGTQEVYALTVKWP
jgi:Tol biopolymer transport system component